MLVAIVDKTGKSFKLIITNYNSILFAYFGAFSYNVLLSQLCGHLGRMYSHSPYDSVPVIEWSPGIDGFSCIEFDYMLVLKGH